MVCTARRSRRPPRRPRGSCDLGAPRVRCRGHVISDERNAADGGVCAWGRVDDKHGLGGKRHGACLGGHDVVDHVNNDLSIVLSESTRGGRSGVVRCHRGSGSRFPCRRGALVSRVVPIVVWPPLALARPSGTFKGVGRRCLSQHDGGHGDCVGPGSSFAGGSQSWGRPRTVVSAVAPTVATHSAGQDRHPTLDHG